MKQASLFSPPYKMKYSFFPLLHTVKRTMNGVTHCVCLVFVCVVSNTGMATYRQLVMLSGQRLHLHLVTDKHKENVCGS